MNQSLSYRLDSSDIAGFLAFWLDNPVLPAEQQRTFDHYYRSYKRHFGPYLRHYYARQTAELVALIETSHNPRVLEVGCGCGTESLWAAMKGGDVTGIDIQSDLLGVAECRRRYLEEKTGKPLACAFRRQSLFDPDAKERFDIVFLEQTFHHLEPRDQVIEKLSQLVVPGGRLIISEINGWNPLIQAFFFKLRGTRTIIEVAGHPWGHERITVPLALIRAFGRRGLATEALTYYRVLPNLRLADRLFHPGLKLPGLFTPLFTHFNLVLRKSPETNSTPRGTNTADD